MELNTVEARKFDDGWVVRVRENEQIYEQFFQVEVFAKSWAAGQARRLKLVDQALALEMAASAN